MGIIQAPSLVWQVALIPNENLTGLFTICWNGEAASRLESIPAHSELCDGVALNPEHEAATLRRIEQRIISARAGCPFTKSR